MASTVLINPESGFAEEFNPQEANNKLQTGYHIPLVDAQGQPYAAPYQEAQQLVQSGTHSQLNDAQLQNLLNATHYNSTEQQAKTLIEGGLRGLGGPAYDYAAPKLGITTAEEIRQRKEHNPGKAAIGELLGTVGGIAALPEASLPGIIGKAGQAVTKGIAAEGFVGKAAATFLQGALEGTAYGASHELSEKVLGNPDSTAEHMLSGIGLSAALGGGLNLALTPIISSIEKAIGLGTGFAGRMTGTAERDAVPGQSISDILPHMGLDESERSGIIEGLTKQKSNAGEIQAAGDLIGAPVLESQISASKMVQNLDSSLMKAGEIGRSWTGIKRQQLVAEGYSAVKNAVNGALGADIGMTRAQVGESLKDGFIESLQAETKPITELYSSVQQLGEKVPLALKQVEGASNDIMSIDGLLSSSGKPLSESSPGYQFAKRASEEIKQLSSVDDLRRYSQQLSRDSLGKPELKYVAGQIKQKLDDLTENSILSFSKEKFPIGSLEAKGVEDLIGQHKLAKAQYSILRDKIGELGGVIGKKLRKGEGPQAFLDWLENTPAEKVADRLFTKNNYKFLEFLQEAYPEQSKLLMNLKKSQFRDAAMVDGAINPNRVLKEIDKLDPEIQHFLFSAEDMAKIKASKTWLESLPKDINPSNTAAAHMSLTQILNPLKTHEVIGGHVADYLKEKTIKQLVRANPADAPLITALSHISNLATKTAKQLDKLSGAIFTNPIRDLMGPNRKEEDKGRANEPLKMNKIGLEVMNNANNPNRLIEHLSTANEQLSQYAPDTMNSLSTSVGRAVNFLASKVPSEGKALPFDAPNKPSNMEIAKFNRYADIVENPMHVLQHVRSGTILPQDIETLSMVYPQLYENMKGKITEKMINFSTKKNIPYETRLGLSVFLGQNLDSTMSPMGIQLSQNALGLNRMEQQAKMAQSASPRPSKTGMRQMKSINQDLTAAQRATARHGRDS